MESLCPVTQQEPEHSLLPTKMESLCPVKVCRRVSPHPRHEYDPIMVTTDLASSCIMECEIYFYLFISMNCYSISEQKHQGMLSL